jgi:putative aldouronate transport system permease protein
MNIIKESSGDRIFTIVNFMLLTVILLVVIYPLVYVVSASFSSSTAVISGRVWLLPVEPTLAGYTAIFQYSRIWTGFMNSIIYTLVGTSLNVVLTVMASYPLSRKDLVGRKAITMYFLFTMMFSGGLIPTYLLVNSLGLVDTRLAMILPVALSVWNVIIARTYFQTTIPDELLEASQMDGCNDFRFLKSVVIPVSGPIIAVISLFYAVSHWNQFFNALIYLKSPSLFPLQLILRDILVQNEVDMSQMTDAKDMAERLGLQELLKYSLIVVATVPLMIVYPFVQKHFVKGVMIGSLKG